MQPEITCALGAKGESLYHNRIDLCSVDLIKVLIIPDLSKISKRHPNVSGDQIVSQN